MLTATFLQLVKKYSFDTELANNLWLEIFTKYSDPKRHYHTIEHLESMLNDLISVKDQISDWDTLLFAVFYHDIVYKATSNTNEADSAKIAVKRLREIGYVKEQIERCSQMILATKLHEFSKDSDINFLLDADLTILGKSAEEYNRYKEQIREEYSIYPDFIYNSGRKKILANFAQMKAIYKTDFFKKYEKNARLNIAAELEEL